MEQKPNGVEVPLIWPERRTKYVDTYSDTQKKYVPHDPHEVLGMTCNPDEQVGVIRNPYKSFPEGTKLHVQLQLKWKISAR